MPPPPSISDSETLAPTGSAPAASSGASVPGYEILRELGRGGMGVVYQARHLKLNRTVALKMILAGGHAGEADLARFQTEAEAIARLQHPNIVQVHEVGEHEGKPFFSLEFCAGGSLERKLAGTPLPPKEAASLVETLARAMQAAHEQHVIHRDLKPANVLLAEDGTPKITDFGLAKKLDEAGQTASGAVMGTPSYMAPEQAGGKSAGIGPLCDVYALGAILYECLTGRPPFKAASGLDTIMQVLSEEPLPPSRLQTKTPRDLETVCLKCLQKEPHKRYASAAALAEDLRRCQHGEPITARPVGRLERAWKWARRRPAAAALLAVSVLAGLALAGTVGAAAAVIYGKNQDLTAERDRAKLAEGEARDEADKARIAEGKALDKEKEARDEAEKARVAEGKARDQAERAENTLLDGLLRPIGHSWNPPDPAERQALADVARLDERLRLRFVGRGLAQPEAAERLGRRSGAVLDAVAGKDTAMRERVRVLALATLREEGADRRVRVAATLLAQPLGETTPEFARAGCLALLEGIGRAADDTSPFRYLDLFHVLVQHLDEAAVREAARAAVNLVPNTAYHRNASAALAKAIAALARWLDAAEGAKVCTEAAKVWGEAATRLVQASPNKEIPASIHLDLVSPVVALAPQMEGPEGAKVCAQAATPLVQALPRAADAITRSQLVHAVVALARPMEGADAARLCTRAATPLVQALLKETNDYARRYLAQAIAALAPRMDEAGARETATPLVQKLGATADASARLYLVQAVAALARQMERAEGAKVCAQVATPLVQALPKETKSDARSWLAEAVVALAPRLDAAGAREAATPLVQALAIETNVETRYELARAVAALAPRLDAPGARAAATPLVLEIRKKGNIAQTRVQLAQAVAELARQLEGAEAAKLCTQAATPLLQALLEENNANARRDLVQAVAALAPRLDAAGAREAATPLVQAIPNKTTNTAARPQLAQAVAALAARLEEVEAAKLCAAAAAPLLQDLPKESNAITRNELAQAVAALAGQLEGAEAAKLCARAATPLLQDLPKESNEINRLYLAQAVAALAPRLNTAEGASAARASLDEFLHALKRSAEDQVAPLSQAAGAAAEWTTPAELVGLH
jgi:hypothetical protein